jgi:Holliday junction resolvase-like predicted endonuclease
MKWLERLSLVFVKITTWFQSRLREAVLGWRCFVHKTYEPFILGKPISRAEIGAYGEMLAARWLSRNRRKVLYRNYRGPHRGEVDIVCRHGDVLAFVEVKTRTREDHGRPADAVNAEKQRLIQRGAQEWMRLLGNPKIKFRFDIVEVVLTAGEKPRIGVIENAFQLPDSSTLGR